MGLKQAFEACAPKLVWAAYDYALNAAEIDLLWVHIVYQDTGMTVNVVYKVGSKIVEANSIHEEISSIPYDLNTLIEFYDFEMECVEEMFDAADEAGEELPGRIIMRFRPSDEDFHADFFYGDLEPGVPEDERTQLSRYVDAWKHRLQATGNDSAAP